MGVVNYNGGSFMDYCINSNMVAEQLCLDGFRVEMPTACPSGKSCSNGACLSPLCLDSDANSTYPDGKNYFTKGQFNVVPFPTDYCQGDILYEAYCDANGKPAMQQEKIDCKARFGANYKCINGACGK